jgi:hypothetical protein
MKRFATLYAALDATTSTNVKLEALITYFASAAPEDAAWASYFLAGGKPRQTVPTRVLADAARERAGLPEWSRIRPWAIWPRRSPICCRRPRANRRWGSRNGSSSACWACAVSIRRRCASA